MAAYPQALLHRFEIRQALGSGGMGTVVEAYDRATGSVVALKSVTDPDATADPGRLHAECRLLTTFDHPGIMAVYDVVLAGDRLWMVSEVVPGARLDRFLDDLGDDAGEGAVALTRSLLATLGWTHRRGILHGDLKPGNILVRMLGGAPWPVLIDFGLSQTTDTARFIGGTERYLAPELRKGGVPSARTDLYAIGVALERVSKRFVALAPLVTALTHADPAARPIDADAAAQLLPISGAVKARTPAFGVRGAETLWGDGTLERLTQATAASGNHHIRLFAADDAYSFAQRLSVEITLDQRRNLVLTPGGGLRQWTTLIACGTGLVVHVGPRADAADTVEVADVFANRAIAALSGAGVRLPTLVIAGFSSLTTVERFVLARLLEAEVVAGAVLVSGPEAKATLGRGLDVGLTHHRVVLPDEDSVERFLDAHGVVLSTSAQTLVRARAAAGVVGLRAMIGSWVHQGFLAPRPDGNWVLVDDVDPAELDTASEDMDAVWRALFGGLGLTGQHVLQTLDALGGGASRVAVEALVKQVLPGSWAELAAAGWTRQAMGRVVLTDAATRRVAAGVLGFEPPSASRRASWIKALETQANRTKSAEMALATHLDAAARPASALPRWEQAARLAMDSLDAAGAGRALSAASRSAEAAGDSGKAYALAAAAAGEWVAVGKAVSMDAALSRLQTLAAGLNDPERDVQTASITARIAIRSADAKAALKAADRGLAMPGSGRVRLELWLARGTALTQLGETDAASAALAKALESAGQLGDDHALGRIGNNLGILEFNLGRFAEAAVAWASASDAKRRTGDRRGERICIGNSALALREQGDLLGAFRQSEAALALATTIRDRLGTRMGALGVTQLWLDIGLPDQAETALSAFSGGGSRLAEADAALLTSRIGLARGKLEEAARGAGDVLDTARAAGWRGTIGEAWSLLYLVAARGDLLDTDWVVAHLGDAPAETVEQLDTDPTPWPTLQACRAHAMAVDGRWGAARRLLEDTLTTLLRPAPPRATDALELCWRAAQLTGPATLAAEVRDRLEEVLVARFAAQQAIVPTIGQPSEVLAETLGLPQPAPDSAHFMQLQSQQNQMTDHDRDPATSPEGTHLTMQQQMILETVEALSLERIGDTPMWADALMEATGADACQVMAFVDDSPTTVALVGALIGAETRFVGVARRLHRGAAPLLADRADGRLEAIGMALDIALDTPPVGAVFLTWADDGRGGAPGLVDALRPTASCLALAVDRGLQAQLLAAATTEIARLQALLAEERDEVTALRDALDQSRSQLALHYDYSAIVHASRAFRRVLQMLDKVTDTDIPVLLLGESGVGKEVLARALHYNGSRRGQRFVAENCGAIPRELFESVFFGHVRGAFTGAHQPKKGLLDAANQGTLFLDEIGELSMDHQVKLLRVIQEKRYRPVGASRELPADFRLVCATNRDLEAMVAAGTFREDLYYRLAVVSIPIPALRERRDDVLPLVERFLQAQRDRLGTPLVLSPGATRRLVGHGWPGNVRELENEILRAAVLSDGEVIREAHLSPRLLSEPAAGSRRPGQVGNLWLTQDETLQDVLQMVEAEVVREALERNDGKKNVTARQLGLSRPGLDAKIARHDIDVAAVKARAKTRKSEA